MAGQARDPPAPRHRWARIQPDRQKTQTQAAAQLKDVPAVDGRPASAPGPPHREIDWIGHRETVDALEQECEVERPLQLDDHRRFDATCPYHVTAFDLTLDRVALLLEEGLDGRVQVGLRRTRLRAHGSCYDVRRAFPLKRDDARPQSCAGLFLEECHSAAVSPMSFAGRCPAHGGQSPPAEDPETSVGAGTRGAPRRPSGCCHDGLARPPGLLFVGAPSSFLGGTAVAEVPDREMVGFVESTRHVAEGA